MRAILYAIGVTATFWVISVAIRTAAAEPAPTVRVGEVYLFVMDCGAGVGCYGEVHRIKAIGTDGWVDTEQCEDQPCRRTSAWRMNLNHVIAVQPYRIGKAANE